MSIHTGGKIVKNNEKSKDDCIADFKREKQSLPST